MNKCTNTKIGGLIHAYELKTLNDEDIEKFELHLLECDYCFNELSSFNDEVSMLLSDDQIKLTLEKQVSPDIVPSAPSPKFWQRLWPARAPLVLKPAFIYGVAALIIFAWLSDAKWNSAENIRLIQSIGLYQTRSGEANVFYKDRSKDAVINFIAPGYDGQAVVMVSISDNEGDPIYRNDRFTEIEKSGLGRLYLALDNLEKGEYTLKIGIPENNPPFDRSIYSFEIK